MPSRPSRRQGAGHRLDRRLAGHVAEPAVGRPGDHRGTEVDDHAAAPAHSGRAARVTRNTLTTFERSMPEVRPAREPRGRPDLGASVVDQDVDAAGVRGRGDQASGRLDVAPGTGSRAGARKLGDGCLEPVARTRADVVRRGGRDGVGVRARADPSATVIGRPRRSSALLRLTHGRRPPRPARLRPASRMRSSCSSNQTPW